MKGKSSVKRRNRRKAMEAGGKMKGTLGRHLQLQLGLQYQHQPTTSGATSASNRPASSRFQNLLDSESADVPALNVDEKDLILSQDFFCTPDYITPDNQNLLNGFDCNKENIPCPKSPEKLKTAKITKRRQGDILVNNPLSPTLSDQPTLELAKDTFSENEEDVEKTTVNATRKLQGFVSQSAVALRCRVMPPPCIKNPYLSDGLGLDVDPFGNQRSKCAGTAPVSRLLSEAVVIAKRIFFWPDFVLQSAGLFPAIVGGTGLSRYHTDFHEIQQIGEGNFNRVFKVLKRIDGCLYAVKHCTRQLHQDTERRRALMEVQALAALGCHENIVGYYSSWFENEQLYIQMELCECSLSINNLSTLFSDGEVLEVLYQIAKALQFMHERGIAHLDVKPDNIYVKNGVYKLGDFGCATLLDQSLPIEEGDARYMPQEILNENYDHLDKVDVFSLGAAIYELVRGSPFPESGSKSFSLKEGKLPLLPGHSLQFQNLLKVMVDPDPVRRPSAKQLIENPIFDKVKRKS